MLNTADTEVTLADSKLAAARKLLIERAVQLQLAGPGMDEDTAIEAVLEHEIQTPEPTIEECTRFYLTHPEHFTAGELVCARHILFAVTPGMPVERVRAKAEETLHALRQDTSLFDAFARELSNCPSGALGGHLGQLGRGDSAPEFEAALFDNDAVGLLPRLVCTRYGFHIVAIEGRLNGQLAPFEAVDRQIATYLRHRVEREAVRQYLTLLCRKSAPSDSPVNPLLQ